MVVLEDKQRSGPKLNIWLVSHDPGTRRKVPSYTWGGYRWIDWHTYSSFLPHSHLYEFLFLMADNLIKKAHLNVFHGG